MAGEHVATINYSDSPTAVEQRFRRGIAVVQNVCVFAMETPPQSAKPLRELITQIRTNQSADGPLKEVKTLHFLSMTVFEDERFDPTFVLEANFDGAAGPFWADLEAAIGPQLREILRFGTRPNGLLGDKFDVVTKPDSPAPIAPFLEALAVSPTAVHQGDRGTSCVQIKQETELFGAVQAALGGASQLRGDSAEAIHKALRAKLIQDHPILRMPLRLVARDWSIAPDLLKLLRFVTLIILALNVPGLLLAWIISPLWAAIVFGMATLMLGLILWKDVRNLATDLKDGGNFFVQGKVIAVAIGIIALAEILSAIAVVILHLDIAALAPAHAALETNTPILGVLSEQLDHIRTAWKAAEPVQRLFQVLWAESITGFQLAGAGVIGAFASALLIVQRLRVLERQDSSHHQPESDSQIEREIAALEDRGEQNHMSGLVHIKPGFVRSILMNGGLNFLGLAIRANPQSAFDGYLVTVRTIHFAHLTLVSNGARLLFLANFDGTWNNYLVDFIEKVHTWLTLVWTNGLGFPPTRFFVFDGATHSRLFTNWQRQSMAPTLYWFRAYPNLSVEQIRRQGAIADGLRQTSLKPKEAKSWALLL
jgi:hypothetical protein